MKFKFLKNKSYWSFLIVYVVLIVGLVQVEKGDSNANIKSVAAKALEKYRIDQADIRNLYKLEPPAWSFYEATSNPESSTNIRNKLSNNKRLQT